MERPPILALVTNPLGAAWCYPMVVLADASDAGCAIVVLVAGGAVVGGTVVVGGMVVVVVVVVGGTQSGSG